MNMPGFTAEVSLYEMSGRYQATMYSIAPTTGIVAQQWCPPPGACVKASNCCIDFELTPGCCRTWGRCLDCGIDW
jgi:hypothetical protein